MAKRPLIFATVLESKNSSSGGIGPVGLLTPTLTFVVLFFLSLCCTNDSVYLSIRAGFAFGPALF